MSNPQTHQGTGREESSMTGTTVTSPGASIRRREALEDPIERFARVMEIRYAEDAVNAMFAEGKIHGTTHLAQGQEALAVGLASVTRPDDAVTATYRGHAMALALGMPPEVMMAEIMGRTGGSTGGVGGSMHLVDMEVGLLPTFAIVGAGLPVAAGAALAFQVREEDRVAVAVFGDGTTNIGAFHESLNLAAIWKLPVLFVIDNNVYGEYSRWNITTPIEDLHRRADSYAMESAVVDGMDIDAVRSTLGQAVERIRGGSGPMLVEAKTYRFSGHSRSDTAPYRVPGELEKWQERDPVKVTRELLLSSGAATAEQLDEVAQRARTAVDEAIAAAEAMPTPTLEAMFRNVVTTPLPASAGSES